MARGWVMVGLPPSLRSIKPEVRILGLGCGDVEASRKRALYVVGVVFRGGRWLDGVLVVAVRPQSEASSLKVAKTIKRSGHYGQTRLLMVHGELTRYVDVERLFEAVRLPLVVLYESEAGDRSRGKMPPGSIKASKEASPVVGTTGEVRLKAYCAGLTWEQATQIMRLSTREGSVLPEPLRVSGLLASSLNSAASRA